MLNTFQKAKPIDESKLNSLLKEHKLSPSEYGLVREILGRAPTIAELGIFSAMWSEHCSYKSSRKFLATLPTTGEQVVVGPGENAGVVRLRDHVCIAFKMESHNHPSYIEPYHGAATGVGGIMRDVFCMGARPIANLNCLRFGRKSHPKTSKLFERVVKGIGDYGNCVGVPTVGGGISFDSSYDGNCLVNAMTVGLIDDRKIFKGFASGLGNYVVYVGSATGRDGIHGATMASESFADASGVAKNTIQVGDPFMENLLMEATLEVLEKDLVVGLQDMGAAGLTSSAVEMAGRAGNGLLLDFNKVPTRTTNKMSVYELLLSESQERMLMVVKPEKWPKLKEVLDKWLLANAIIGEVTDTGKIQIHYDDVLEVDLPVQPLTDAAPKYSRPQQHPEQFLSIEDYDTKIKSSLGTKAISQVLKDILKNSGSKKIIYTQYDHHIGARTVHGPDSQGAAVLRVFNDQDSTSDTSDYLGVAVSACSFEDIGKHHSDHGGQYAVLKCARMIAATGGKPLAITDCLNFGNPEDPTIMAQFANAIQGIRTACLALDTPVVSGNVSLYNETGKKSIHPTPMIGMVGRVEDVRNTSPAIINKPCYVYLLQTTNTQKHFAGSMAAKTLLDEQTDHISGIKIDWESEAKLINWLTKLNRKDVIAVRDISSSGLLATCSKMLLDQNDLGLTFIGDWTLTNLFAQLSSSYLLAHTSDHFSVAEPGVNVKLIAKVDFGESLTVQGMMILMSELRKASLEFCDFEEPHV